MAMLKSSAFDMVSESKDTCNEVKNTLNDTKLFTS